VKLVALVLIAACGGSAGPSRPAAPPPAKSVQLNQPGEPVELASALTPGYVTVVDFWSESCGACVIVGGMLAAQTASADAVLIRKVDVGDGFSPVAKQYKISALPHYNVYDKQQRLRYVLVGNDCLKAPDLAKQLAAEN
jgi:thiol-disulfide isomerase/thioredoxin